MDAAQRERLRPRAELGSDGALMKLVQINHGAHGPLQVLFAGMIGGLVADLIDIFIGRCPGARNSLDPRDMARWRKQGGGPRACSPVQRGSPLLSRRYTLSDRWRDKTWSFP